MNVGTVKANQAMDFDPFGMVFRNDPAGLYETLLGASPGFIDMEGVPSAFVATNAHCSAVMRDVKRFSSVKPKGLPGMERIDFFNSQPVMNYSDPPHHLRLRRVVNSAFTPGRVAEMAIATQAMIDDMFGRLLPGEVVDVAKVTKTLSIQLLFGEFLGIAEQDRPIFMRFLSTLPTLDHVRPGEGKPQAYIDAWDAGVAYCKQAIEVTRTQKSKSLIGMIAEASGEGGTLSDDETMAMMVVLFTGGVSTVASSATAALLNIARNPHVAERVRQDTAAAGLVLEESMRLNPPILCVMRFTTEDTEIGGRIIKGGMPVYSMISAACHDAEAWPDPFKFDIDRPNLKNHMAFGHGIHTCIGNAIARATVPMIVTAVANQFPGLKVTNPDAPLEWETTPRSRHLASLELTF